MRCYDGCPDTQLQAYLDIEKAGFSVTYFPDGEFYIGFKDYRPVTKECKTLTECATELGVLCQS